MTLEESTRQALDAAERGDPGKLAEALEARAAAIAALVRLEPSPQLLQRLAAALGTGDALNAALSAFKVRIRTESSRIAQIQAGLAAGIAAPSKTHIDCHA